MNAIDVRNNLMTFITAGHETTALALTWTFYLLGLHPAVEERVRGEIAACAQRSAAKETKTTYHMICGMWF